jgi:hypothetical protein
MATAVLPSARTNLESLYPRHCSTVDASRRSRRGWSEEAIRKLLDALEKQGETEASPCGLR